MNNIDVKAFLDPETNDIHEIYTIFDGKNVTFNLNGAPFKFENFILVTTRQKDVLSSIFIHIPRLSQEGLEKISTFLELPVDKYDLKEMGEELVVRLEMKEEAITKFINPKFNTIRNLKQFFMMRDDVGGSVILDFFYYTITNVEAIPIIIPEEELNIAS
ncbi:MAG: hypothetical protein U0354_15785 [Candidatus Sericytochromatia bacterium]